MENTLRDSERDYWENRLGKDVPLNSVGYHGLSDAFVAWLYRVRAARFTQAVRSFARPGLRVLDIGSGGGFYIDLWRRLGVTDVTASDLTQASLDAIARRFPGTATIRFDAGADNVPLADGSFDAISCMDVVHHLMDDAQYERAIANCARLLKPGGMLVFTDNFLHGPAFRAAHSLSRPLIQIERILRGNGFSIESRRPMFVLMNNPIDSRSPAHALFWKCVSYMSENRVLGAIFGAAMYPAELALTSLLDEGPSTELCVARRSNGYL
ncbi:MAG TPA: class I SAM-dependent methyltransferase [Candidatus Baltobacteraceae bacterium]|jgi:2-polyprenyl-3-methyl-5-hydroxy-6-metoxy-1,4-benzoquinol methylase|nr:class I SAM-dependent methyltransferase [Candidatus Baltobacteraceae bacterium]